MRKLKQNFTLEMVSALIIHLMCMAWIQKELTGSILSYRKCDLNTLTYLRQIHADKPVVGKKITFHTFKTWRFKEISYKCLFVR